MTITTNRVRINVEEVAAHRNGIGGEPFRVVTFRYRVQGERVDRAMVGIVFETRKNQSPRVAVFDREALGKGAIAFGGIDDDENSWRGDDFAPALQQAIEKWDAIERGDIQAPLGVRD
jgi:hypothetical protein